MTGLLGILFPAMAGLAFPFAAGIVQLGCLVEAIRIARASDPRFRLAIHASHAALVASVIHTVFSLGYPGSTILYFSPPALLCMAHLLGTRPTVFWTLPWTAMIVASELVPIPNSIDPSSGEKIVIEIGMLFAAVAFAVSLRRAYDHKAAELQVLATTDPLTGLANRRQFAASMADAVARARRFGRHGAILFIDIDGVKRVNDRHGHRVGDALILEVAHRLENQVRSIDLAARIGGDEFVILMSEFENPKAPAFFTQKLIQLLRFTPDDEVLPIEASASIGIAGFPDLDSDPERLLALADEAMYAAKQAGGDCIYRATEDGAAPLD